jgi:hypothetical protein
MQWKDRAYAEALKLRITEKMQALLDEFAEGKISREQFHQLYERYNERLETIDHALEEGDAQLLGGVLAQAQSGPATIHIKEATKGKAQGIIIYFTADARPLETLGQFNVPAEKVSAALSEFARLSRPESRSERLGEGQWVLFTVGHFTTVITQFRNEPARQQIRDMERLHRDFENANRTHFQEGRVDSQKLAYPFLAFIQRKLGKTPS